MEMKHYNTTYLSSPILKGNGESEGEGERYSISVKIYLQESKNIKWSIFCSLSNSPY